jgi:tRNA-(ms[2]io[6]A)-hydroxylase
MLHLAAQTDPAWVQRVASDLDELLLDHAHCEQKAAGNAVSLLFRYPQHGFLMQPLAALAREELLHFQQVLERLEARGARFRPQRASPYAGRLRTIVRGAEPERLLDTLLCSSVIEARSCERFALLAEGLSDLGLAAFYRELLICEARHHAVFLELAEALAPRHAVRARLEEISRFEAEVLASSPPLVRLHA